MKFQEVYFKNLLSFEEVIIKLDQTNIIVGPNNSGKTNILRILDFLSNGTVPLSVLRLPKNLKRDQRIGSVIGMELELSKDEAIMLFQFIFQREITEAIPANLCKLKILIRWDNIIDDEANSDHIIIRFDNSLTAIGSEHLKFFGTIKNDWDYLTHISLDELFKNGRQLDPTHFSFLNKDFQADLLSGRKFIDMAGDTTYLSHEVKAQIENSTASKIYSDVFNFLGVKKEYGAYIMIWQFFNKILHNSISIVKDTRPTIQELADAIHKWRDQHELEYQKLVNDFTSLFPNTTFYLLKNTNSTNIQINEHKKNFSLENSASGYFAGLYLLFTIYGKKENTLFFDEPETHFHPSKLMVLSNKLLELSSKDRNQISIITHSPVLLDFSMFQNNSCNVIYINRKNNNSEVYQPKSGFIPNVNSHHFDPSVFFESGCIIVEGPSDEYAIKGISDSYNQLLKKSSIALVNAGGKNQVEPFVLLLKEYGIPYVAMVDSDYSGFSDNVIKLERDLEFEFEKIGWNRKIHENGGKEKIRAEKAYDFMIDYLKDDSNKSKFEELSIFWQIIKKII